MRRGRASADSRGLPRRGSSPTAARGGLLAGTLGLPLAAMLLALWLLLDPRTPDLAAQVYRTGLFEHLGFAVWEEHWYAGHDLIGYSLLFPALASLLGVRVLGALCVLTSVVLFERIAVSAFGPPARWGAAFFALAAAGDVWMGRLSFALGVSFALGAVLALMRGRTGWAALAAALCAASSPVAGLLLALGAVSYSLSERSARAALPLALPVAAVIVPLALLFPEGGYEPYPLSSFLATAAVAAAFLVTVPREQRLLRAGGVVYVAACVLSLAVRTPMGSNVERYGVLLAGPLLACALAAARPRRGRVPAQALALGVIALWVVWGPVRETLAVAGNDSTQASYYVPVERFLARVAGGPAPAVRVEVPLTRSHWEVALLAPKVSLAGGWEKQLAERFDHVLSGGGLSVAAYGHWLHEQAVDYVALPDAPLDPASAQEGRLIRGGLPYLRLVFASRHWRVYAVHAPTPLVSGPGRLSSLGEDSFTLHAWAAGSLLVRVHFSRYLGLSGAVGCVRPAPGGWTRVTLEAPGSARVDAHFSIARALGGAGSCSRTSAA